MIQLLGEQIPVPELVAAAFGIFGVWLTVKENILCFPVGLINTGLYGWVFFSSKLYADSFLQVIYILLLIYGWYHWSHGKRQNSELPVTKARRKTSLYLIIIVLLSTVVTGVLMKKYTDASLPYVDSLTTSMSLVAQWMVARKKIENWLVWIVADIIYVGMYVFKHLYVTSLLYFIFIILAIIGWQQWKKELIKKEMLSH